MNQINLAKNIMRLRHEKQITQEQLADFLGVTKASVSKWENQQSMPDILLLPRLAAFFGVSIDGLMGYEPQLSREQIQKLYQELARLFAEAPFAQAMEKTRELARSYYSCYPFLQQICVLLLNHFMMPEDKELQREILREIEALCDHIIENSGAVNLCNDAMGLKATAGLQLGKAEEVAEMLEHITAPLRISSQNEMLLIRAYQMAGDIPKAKSHNQITIYSHLLSVLGSGIQYLALEMPNLERCQETIRRLEGLIELYGVERLNPNSAAQFYYQSALVYAFHEKKRQTMEWLQRYAKAVEILLQTDKARLHGDGYFDRLDDWIEKLELGAEPPRSPKMIQDSLGESLEHPLFVQLQDSREFQRLRESWRQEERREFI